MAINSDDEFWNLLEIVETENGITKLPNEYKVNGEYNFLDYKNVYSKETLTNFKYDNLPKINIFEKDKNKFYTSKQNSIAVTWSSETNKDVFQAAFIETSKPFILNGFSKLLYVQKEYDVLPKWLTWYLNYDFSIQKQRESIPYTTRCNMTKNEMKNIKIKKVPLNVQQEIINIIEPKEQLFLKYHKVVDISDLDKFKPSWSNLINIIEPFEKLKESLITKIQELNKIFNNFKDENIEQKIHLKNISSIRTGNKNANFASNNGVYRFFTCSLNKIQYCNSFEYNGEVILLAGNGDIGEIKYFNGKFNAYQRTYIIQTNLIGNVYYSLLIKRKFFKNNSKGSVVKFLTLSTIQNLEVNIDKTKNYIRYKIICLSFQYEQIILILNKIIWKLIKLLLI